jgi:MFS family permease
MAVEAAPQPGAAPPARRTALRALEVRDFRLLWYNSFSFFLARGMQLVAISWLVLELTDSPSLVGAVLFAQGIPLALFSLPAGVWADRMDRKRLLIISQGASAALTAVLAALILTDLVTTWSVFVLAFLMGSAMALGQPSRQALVPALVGPERLLNAIVLNNLVQNLSFVVGPAVAGGLLAGVGAGGTFAVQVGVLGAGLPLLLTMRAPAHVRPAGVPATSGMTALREGLAHIAESSFIRSLFIVTAVTGIFFVGTHQALLPVFARDVLDINLLGLEMRDEVGFGLLSASFGVGMFSGSLFIASRGDLSRKGEVLLRSLAVGSLVFFVFAVSRWFELSLLMMLAWGFGAAFFMNLTITLIQSHTPDRLMGRVIAGGLAEAFGAPVAAVVGAAAVGLMSVTFLLRQPELRSAS